jgi:hypothetical protein
MGLEPSDCGGPRKPRFPAPTMRRRGLGCGGRYCCREEDQGEGAEAPALSRSRSFCISPRVSGPPGESKNRRNHSRAPAEPAQVLHAVSPVAPVPPHGDGGQRRLRILEWCKSAGKLAKPCADALGHVSPLPPPSRSTSGDPSYLSGCPVEALRDSPDAIPAFPGQSVSRGQYVCTDSATPAARCSALRVGTASRAT